MKHSEMLNLNLPEDSDLINVGQISDNFERLDSMVDILPVQQEITTTDIDVTIYPPYWSMTNNTDSNIAYIDHKFFDEEFVIKPGQTIRTDIDTPTEISISSETTLDYVYYIPAKEAFSGGGGGDTSDYNKLSNQPKINGVKLVGDKSASDLGLAAASDLSDKVSSSEKGASNGIATLDADGKVPQSQLPTPVAQREYKLTETTSESYAKSYKLQIKNGETWSDVSESASINIPKDMVVESGSVKTCTEADTPVQGYAVGDKYIDLVIANADDEHIYILVSDLVSNTADGISYDNTESGLEAVNVQSAVDELAENKADKTEISNVVKAPNDETARIGQSLYVAEVDEDGKPTKWTYSDPEPPDPLAPIMDKDISELTYDEIAIIVRAGRAEEKFHIGDQIITKYTDTSGTQYDMPFDVVAFRDVELEDNSTVPGMIIQSHYATVENMQFDAPEPSSSDSNIQSYGWNRWMYSGVRQWLNSSANKGAWWKSTHSDDIAPSQLSSINGFMKGFSTDFINMLKKTKHETALNYIYPSGSETVYVYDTTYDTFFLPSLKEEHFRSANFPNRYDDSDREGSTWEYWIQRKGETAQDFSPSYADTSAIRYSLADRSTAKNVWLRSASRSSSHYEFYVVTGGYCGTSGSSISFYCAPACVIC